MPYEQSADMAKELARKGVEHELVTLKGAGHGLGASSRVVVVKTYDKVTAFLNKHLG